MLTGDVVKRLSVASVTVSAVRMLAAQAALAMGIETVACSVNVIVAETAFLLIPLPHVAVALVGAEVLQKSGVRQIGRKMRNAGDHVIASAMMIGRT